jgi:ElaB/YqjD/DUF883 family membrane-anchored ribosome-binding protein
MVVLIIPIRIVLLSIVESLHVYSLILDFKFVSLPVYFSLVLQAIQETKLLLSENIYELEDRITGDQRIDADSNHDDIEITNLQNKMKQELQEFRNKVNKNVDTLEEKVAAVSNKKDPTVHAEYLKSVKETLRPLHTLIDSLFNKLSHLIKNVCCWIQEKAHNIIEHIREAFRKMREELF